MPIKIIEYKGKEIRYVDYRNMNEEQFLETVTENVNQIKETGEKVRILADFRGLKTIGKPILDFAMNLTRENAFLEEKVAVIGISDVKLILLKIYNSFRKDKPMVSFKTKAEAMDWLVK